MWLLLLACVDPSVEGPVLPDAGTGSATRHAQPSALPLPPTLPFTAYTRTVPVTLVDPRGAPLLVLEGLGVELEVQRLLADRALVRCTGCRAEVDEAWVQLSSLFVGDQVGDGPHDALLAWLHAPPPEGPPDPARQLARHGLVRAQPVKPSTPWIAPPWHAEGGYSGGVVEVKGSAGSWRVELRDPEPPTDPAEP